jgi:porphobilinogen deaminase
VEKCIEGQYDAIVLARAGLERLKLNPSPLMVFDLDPEHWIPAPAQGALGLQCRENDGGTRMRLAALECDRSRLAVSVERRILQLSEAGCHAPLGAHLVFRNGGAELNAGTQSVSGRWVAITRSEGIERVEGLGDEGFELLRSARDEDQSAPVARPEKGIGSIATPAEPWWKEQTE